MGVPSGYTPLEYVEFTGIQFFDTGIVPDYNTVIEATFSRATSDKQYLYGAMSDDNKESVSAYMSTAGNWRFGNKYISYTIKANSTFHTVVVDNTGIVMDGTKSSYTPSNFTAPVSLALGTCKNADGSFNSERFEGNLCNFKIRKAGILLANYISYMTSNGTVVLYDLVTDAPLTNLGSGALVAGPVVVPPQTHNALIDGVTYAVSGGNGMVDGTVCKISGGKVLIDGTLYDACFGDKNITFSVDDSRHENGSIYTFQAEEGMTWREFIGSEYDTSGGRLLIFEYNKPDVVCFLITEFDVMKPAPVYANGITGNASGYATADMSIVDGRTYLV